MRISDWSSDVCSSDLLDDWRHFLVEWHFEVIVAEQDDSLRLFLQGRIDNRAEVAVRVASEEADDKGRIRRQSGRTTTPSRSGEISPGTLATRQYTSSSFSQGLIGTGCPIVRATAIRN